MDFPDFASREPPFLQLDLDFQEDNVLTLRESVTQIAQSVIEMASKAVMCKSFCSRISSQIKVIRKTINTMSASKEFDRPFRYMLRLVFEKLNHTLSEMKLFCESYLFPEDDLVLRLPSLESMIDHLCHDLLWVANLLNDGYRKQRVENKGKITFTLPPLTFIDTNTAVAWAGIVSLFKNEPRHKKSAAQDVRFLDCGEQTLVDEGVIPLLLKILGDPKEQNTFKRACAESLVALVGVVDTAKSILSAPKLIGSFVKLLNTNTPASVLVHIMDIVYTIATTCEMFKISFGAAQGGTLATIRILESGMSHLLGLGLEMDGEGSSSMVNLTKAALDKNPNALRVKLLCLKSLVSLTDGCNVNIGIIGRSSGLTFVLRLSKYNDPEINEMCSKIVFNLSLLAEEDIAFKSFLFGSRNVAHQVKSYLIDCIDCEQLSVRKRAIQTIGNFSTKFGAANDQTCTVLDLLLEKNLLHDDPQISSESARTLKKFTSPDNYQHEHFGRLVNFSTL